jgi:hypothetical protein
MDAQQGTEIGLAECCRYKVAHDSNLDEMGGCWGGLVPGLVIPRSGAALSNTRWLAFESGRWWLIAQRQIAV